MTRDHTPVRALAAASMMLIAPAGFGVPANQSRPSSTTFFVYYHSVKGPIVGRKDVQVLLLTGDGSNRLGVTDGGGEITLRWADLTVPGAMALLFCEPKLPEICAAVRIDSDFLRGFSEFNVHLPLGETIDRFRVLSR